VSPRPKSRKAFTMPAWLACQKYKIPETTFYRAIKNGQIPVRTEYVMRRRVREKDVRAWMAKHWKRRTRHPKATNIVLKRLRPVSERAKAVIDALPRDGGGHFAKRSDGQTTIRAKLTQEERREVSLRNLRKAWDARTDNTQIITKEAP
jgi:predicted DNA-binding transcriptional regulator AlpA